MELAKLLLIRLKIVLRYRLLLVLTLIHLFIIIIYVQSFTQTQSIKSKNYIISKTENAYVTKDAILYTDKEYEIGQLIVYSGECINNKQRNFIDFDYSKYLISNGIKCSLYEPKISALNKTNIFYSSKHKIRNKILKRDNVGLKQALIFGDKSNITDHTKELFYNLHLAHLLALSGMHIALITVFVRSIFKKIFKVKEHLDIVVIIFLSLYCMLVDYSYSIIRTFLILYLVQILNMLDFKVNKLNTFLIVVNTVLLFNPFAIFSYSFIYSFLCYFIIILCSEKKYNFIKLYISITLFTIIITINLNNQINILGLLLAPLITILFEVLYFPYLLLTTMFTINDIFSTSFLKLLDILYIKNFNFIIKDFNFFSTSLYYILLFYIFSSRKIKIINVVLCICIILLPFTLKTKKIEIMFFDVGQGDATLIMLDNGKTILIDGGGNIVDQKKSDDIAKYTIIPYLKKTGIRQIDYIIATHGDIDHIGSLEYITKNYKYSKLYINCNEVNEYEKNLNGEKLTSLSLESKNYNINFSCNNNENENDSSIITSATFHNRTFLSLGDLSYEYEEQINENVDILKVSHHGSNSSTSKKFIENINPKYSIISVGKNSYGHPTKEVLNNLETTKILRTDKNGAIRITITKDSKIKYETMITK